MARSDGYRREFDALIAECKAAFISFEESLKEKVDELETIKASFEKSADSAESAVTAIFKYHSELFENDKDGNLSIVEDIEDSHEKINKWYAETQGFRNELLGFLKYTYAKEITEQEATALGEGKFLKNNESKYFTKETVKVPGFIETAKESMTELANSLDSLRTEFDELESESTQQFEMQRAGFAQDVEGIKAELQRLLPGATAAGLASAYEEARRDHKRQSIVWQFGFLVTIMAIVALAFFLPLPEFVAGETSAWDRTLLRLLYLAPFEAPLVWLAWMAGKKSNQHTRLYEEYLHKWAIARTFSGLQNAAQDIEADNREGGPVADLYTRTLHAYSSNPSETLNGRASSDSPMEILQLATEAFGKKAKDAVSAGVDTALSKFPVAQKAEAEERDSA